MTDHREVTVTNRSLVRLLGDQLIIGSAFAFLDAKALDCPALQWVRTLMGPQAAARPLVISLLGKEAVELPGGCVEATALPGVQLRSITADKALYREGRDVVNLLVLDLGARETGTVVTSGGTEYSRQTLTLGTNGVARMVLRDLPCGSYQVGFPGASEDEPACTFNVAEYRLAPLVAQLEDRRLEGSPPRLAVRLRLETFGVAVEGEVRLELHDRGFRVAEQRVLATGGTLEASFVLEGAGPHSLELQLVTDPSRTASVPIVGSRATERSLTTFSKLGTEVAGSLLPADGAREVRGIWLEEGAATTTPLRLEQVDTRRARITAAADAEAIHVVLADPGGDTIRSEQRETLAAGDTLEIDLPGPAALMTVGAFVAGKPWEGWAVLLVPADLEPQVIVPERVVPGGKLRVEVKTGRPDQAAVVWLLVKDARLPSPDSPSSRLAGRLKALAEATGEILSVGHPTDKLTDFEDTTAFVEFGGLPGALESGVYAEIPLRSPSPVAMGMEDVAEIMATTGAAANGPVKGGRAVIMGDLADGPAPKRQPATGDEPEVLFAGLIEAPSGLAVTTLQLPPVFADYVVEALVVSEQDWAPANARFRAEKDPFVSLDLAAFVHADDTSVGRLHVGCASGRARVRLTRNGQPVALLLGDHRLEAQEEIVDPRAELEFLAGPGLYEASVEDLGSGATDHAAKQVEEPGKLRRVTRSLTLLQPGERLARADDPAVVALRVMPGIDRSSRRLIDATADYSHACCEQTAAIVLAAAAMYLLSDDDPDRRDKAEAIILAGIRREESMWIQGRGFSMYPQSGQAVDTYYGPMTARYLWNLAMLQNGHGSASTSSALREAADKALEMARDTTAAYGLEWPPVQSRSCEEAYAVLRFGSGDRGRQEAIDLVNLRTAFLGDDGLPKVEGRHGRVACRAEAAYAAAVLLRSGTDLRRALDLANAVLKHVDEQGRLYSTVDSVAAIALMEALRDAGVVGGTGRVRVDGREVTTAEAAETASDVIETLEALEGVVSVEVRRSVEEDWAAFASEVPLTVALTINGKPTRKLALGQATDLEVKLTEGYRNGDMLWVCLPDSLSRLMGGGQVKRFSLDFEGKSFLRIPLAATGLSVGSDGASAPQHYAVCVRNMFEEERAGNPGLLKVTVEPGGSDGALLRLATRLRGLKSGGS